MQTWVARRDYRTVSGGSHRGSMRVLIFEPDHEGHRLHYIRTMLPGLIELSERVTIALASEAPLSKEFAVHLSNLVEQVEIDASMPRPAGGGMKTARAKLRALKQSIARSRARHVYIPYGDGLAQLLGLPGAWRWAIPRGVEVETLLFRGAVAYPQVSAKERAKSRVSFAAATRPPWSALFHLDPLVYDWVKHHGSALADRLQLMADPVEAPSAEERSSILRRLKLPDDGRFVGAAGMMNGGKGTDLLIRAFAAADLGPRDRLLLAGPQNDEIRALLSGEFNSLFRGGRIVSLDRVLPAADLADAIKVTDLVCVLYRRHVGSASIVIRAAAAGRPVLASDFGWCGYTVPQFQLGRVVDVNDPQAVSRAIERSLEESQAFRLSAAAQRFVEFHKPENFGALWSSGLRHRLGLPPPEGGRTWPWVLGAAADELVPA
jgi:glycosyltransferase involved in cell wall biosynthesis